MIVQALLVVLTLSSLCSSSLQGYIVKTKNAAPGIKFNHLKVNTQTQDLFIGAKNRLYRLKPNLDEIQHHVTGPKDDNPDCPPPNQFDCTPGRKSTDNYNRALLIDISNKHLIACSNLFHGYCQKYLLYNITITNGTLYEPVVANNATATTVAYIAPGPAPAPGDPQPNVLYVSATWTNTGLKAYRDKVPAFSMRSLHDFKFITRSGFSKSRIEIESLQRDTFPVRYIYGFSSESFSYMVTVQKEGTQSEKYISKLIRVCNNDKEFYSYAEVRLNCSHNSVNYNLVQAAYVGKASKDLASNLNIVTTQDVLYLVFAVGKPNSPIPTAQSAMCIYPMKEVLKKFTENIQNCFKGEGYTGPDHIVTPKKCTRASFDIEDNYCGNDINTPIDGKDPISANATLLFPANTSLSAIITSTTYDYTVAFVGTTNGYIKKILIESAQMATIYDKDIPVDVGRPILPDMAFDDSRKHLYAMTEHRIVKMVVQNCSQYTSCFDCLGSKDPYCGWCSLENKCSLKEACDNHDMAMRWLPYSGQRCTNITKVIPDQIQIEHLSRATLLTLTIDNMPKFKGDVECTFSYDNDYAKIITPANKTMFNSKVTGVKCMTPLFTQLPSIPNEQDHIVMTISVRVTEQVLAKTNVTFFDCNRHLSCTSCTLSKFPCIWCIRRHVCTNEATTTCRNDSLVTGQGKPGISQSPGPKACPRIELPGGETEILVPSGTQVAIRVQGTNLQKLPLHHTDQLKCFFKLNSGQTVAAKQDLTTNEIICGIHRFEYLGIYSDVSVQFDILWGNDKPLDNPTNIQVKVYKCDVMAHTCGDCFLVLPKYKCGWCNDRCSTRQFCQGTWLDRGQACPNPKIREFSPIKGPEGGGTLLTIKGDNLGQNENDVSVDVGGVTCTITGFRAPDLIECLTGRSKFPSQSDYVSVTVKNQYNDQSNQKFHYVNPRISSIYPTKGPFAGGTRVTIHGHHMDAGKNISIEIGTYSCDLAKRSVDEVVCSTSQNSENHSEYLNIRMEIDDQDIDDNNVRFRYVDNPKIIRTNHLKTIKSGGLNITVFGQYLDNVLKPYLILWVNGQDFEGECYPSVQHKPQRMFCLTPHISVPINGGPVDVNYGFRMDGVLELRNLSKDEHGTFKVYPDPAFTKFDPQIKSHPKKNEVLLIRGKYLFPSVREQDIKVSVGREQCNITSVASDLITCKPPESQPATLTDSQFPEVMVYVGISLNDTIGYLKYEEPETMSTNTIIFIAVGAGALVIIIIIVVIAFIVRSRKSDDMMKKMRIQMDSLEARVANECKEAFAELQTDMTELTSDLYGQVSVPFWDYRTYCMKVLFPGQEDHPVVSDLQINIKSNRDDVERGLKLFQQLIGNKTFLLIFIRTLESNRNFNIRDRVNVASLVSIALQTKMEYATDILKTLLAELIEKSIEGKNHPKLLLRRNESVAEKMLTNWFTFLLYKFLRECAGEPLFMLYQAIKQQVSKGPVDGITSEARYSLSEDKLIRQQLNYKSMTLHVLDLERFPQQTQPVKVLDCDTISQVKEKILDAIYKNAPFSSRPPKEELDLEWANPDKSHPLPYPDKNTRQLMLHDEDNTSKMEGDYKRLNTLAHYQVPDGAYVALVPKQNTPYNNSIISDKSKGYENISFYNRSPSLNRTISPNMVSVDVDNNSYKVYHLVKQHDNDVHNKEGDRGSKMVTEIYLPRLLVTKGTLQQFVDDLFERIFSTAHRGTALPLAIKYMFDFLDDQALHHNIQEPEVIHIWKSNSLPLRFWVNVIKNPNFVFDIFKSNIVDSCLTVVGQTFMDSCSVSEHRLGKDSPSSKLLYAKDIPKYKQWVERYYQDIKMMPAISDQDMAAMLTEESRLHPHEFNTDAALMELYKYLQRYKEDLLTALEEDEFAKRSKLSYKLDQVLAAMEGDTLC